LALPVPLALALTLVLALALTDVVVAVLALALPSVLVVAPILPLPLVRPLAPPLIAPARRLLPLPLLPVSGGNAVVAHRHEQDGPRHEVGSDDDPGAVVSAAHVPAAVGKGPVLAAVEEEVRGRTRHVLHHPHLGNDDERRRRRKVDADIHLHLSV